MLNIKRGLIVSLVAILTVSQAQADGVLTPGKPAGVREAARHRPNLLVIGLASAAAVVGIAIAIGNSSNPACGSACDVSTPTTTS